MKIHEEGQTTNNIDLLIREYNCAIANGLVLKARRISRVIDAFEKKVSK